MFGFCLLRVRVKYRTKLHSALLLCYNMFSVFMAWQSQTIHTYGGGGDYGFRLKIKNVLSLGKEGSVVITCEGA